jgi:hypothetical protein
MIPANDQKVLSVQVLLGIFNASGSPELVFFMNVRDLDPEEGPVTKRFLNCSAKVSKGNDYFTKTKV